MNIAGNLETTFGADDTPVVINFRYDNPDAQGTPVAYVHGWGCSQRDFEGAAIFPSLENRPRLTFDMPGHGESSNFVGDISIANITSILHDVATAAGIGHFAIVGHSVGGLVAVTYATQHQERIAGLVNIVGNMVPEGCFLTGDVADGRATRQSLIERFRGSDNLGFRRYAEGLVRVDNHAYNALAAAAVEACTVGSVLDDFLDLNLPKLFIYGSEAVNTINYLNELRDHSDVAVHEVPGADHFPAIDNPVNYYGVLGSFMAHLDR